MTRNRFFSRIVALAQCFWFDAVILVGLGVGLAAAVVDQHKKDGPRGPLWFDVLVVIAFTTPLLARRRFPTGVLVAVGVVIAASTFVDDRLVQDNFVAFLVGIAACVRFGMRPSRAHAVAGLAFLIGVSVIVSVTDPQGKAGDFAWGAIVFTVAWIIGLAIGGKFREVDAAREQATRAEQAREEQARLAVDEERARIARELHDVVGHSVSVMTVQASAVRMRLDPDQDKERDALLVVEQTGREALAEMRRMVGVLRTSSSASDGATPAG